MFDNIWSTLALIAVMGLLFYFLLIRPQQRRQKEQAKLLDALAPGRTVMLSSGIIVKVVEVGEAQVLVELAPGLEMTVLKQVIINTSANDEFDPDAESVADDGVSQAADGNQDAVSGGAGDDLDSPVDNGGDASAPNRDKE